MILQQKRSTRTELIGYETHTIFLSTGIKRGPNYE